ncbi:DsbA family protein [Actinospica durhamensis]|uniref:DsbA family protein n=1 Tax=Actinospica durhamensis TaxID=1508375 RepID=A0A941EST3_9ACTN|nr:DsbA family protein [Actinospica durhamensis]MBR7836656.1 DsbA family protein [Actinospica durhamensis]
MSGAAEPVLTVCEYTDPACPWAWGSEPKFARLRALLAAAGEGVVWRRVYGILFDEGEAPAPDPAAEAAWYLEEVREISGHTGAPCPQRLEWVAATSWPMALAAKAAQSQGPEVAEAVLHRLRATTFVDGRPADTPERVLAALREVSGPAEGGAAGLDLERLAREAASAEVLAAVRRDHAETRNPCAEVFAITEQSRHPGRAKPLGEDPADGYRYALPTLVFEGAGGRAVAAGWRAPAEYLAAVRRAAPSLYELCDLGTESSR